MLILDDYHKHSDLEQEILYRKKLTPLIVIQNER